MFCDGNKNNSPRVNWILSDWTSGPLQADDSFQERVASTRSWTTAKIIGWTGRRQAGVVSTRNLMIGLQTRMRQRLCGRIWQSGRGFGHVPIYTAMHHRVCDVVLTRPGNRSLPSLMIHHILFPVTVLRPQCLPGSSNGRHVDFSMM